MLKNSISLAALIAAFPATAQAQDPNQSTSAADVEEIIVTGRAQQYYLRTAPSLGNKFPDDLKEIPQSLQILPKTLMEDQGAVEITDLYRNISSVSVFSYSGVTFRGFRQDEIRYDGLLGDPFSGFAVPLLFDIEQVEVIKGPSGALFGGGEPGGVINYVTRGATAENEGFVRIVGGNYDLLGARAEYSGAITEDETLMFRLGAAYENTDTFRFNTDKEDIVLAADLRWKPSDRTDAQFKFDYVKQDFAGARLRGVPVTDDGDFITDIRFNTNEESDFQKLEAYAFTSTLDQRLSDQLTLTLAGRVVLAKEEQNYHENRGLITAEDGTQRVRREYRDQMRDRDQYSALGELVYDTEIAGRQHTFLMGGEYFRQDADDFFLTTSDSRRASSLPEGFIVPDLDFINPNYGDADPATYQPFQELDRTTQFEQWAFYLQDRFEVTDKLTLSLGGRFEGFSEDLNSVRTTLTTGSAAPSAATASDETVTFRAGAVYDWTEKFTTYANFSTGFQPQSASNQENASGPFAPERGRLMEIGAKWDLFDDAVYVQAAAYQINKTNILVADPRPDAPTGALSSIGEARSRGIEVDFVGDLATNWTLAMNYAFNDTVILEGADEIRNAVGDEFANAPDHQFGFWTRYDLTAINSAITFGGDYVSRRVSLSGQDIDPYMIFDAGWITTWRNLQFQVNVRNLFNKVYAESGFISRTGHFPGEPRTVRVELTANF